MRQKSRKERLVVQLWRWLEVDGLRLCHGGVAGLDMDVKKREKSKR